MTLTGKIFVPMWKIIKPVRPFILKGILGVLFQSAVLIDLTVIFLRLVFFCRELFHGLAYFCTNTSVRSCPLR